MRAEQTGIITSLSLLVTLFFMQPCIQLAFWAASTHYWLMSNLSSFSNLNSFSVGLLSIHSSLKIHWYWGLPQLRCRTLHLALLNCTRFVRAHPLSVSRSLWMASLLSSISASSINLVSTENLLRVHSVPLFMSLIKILNNTDHSKDTWGTPLISVFYLDIEPLAVTLQMLPFSQFFIWLTAYLLNPYLSNLAARILWGTMSEALLKFR